jgi:hypothetical protein
MFQSQQKTCLEFSIQQYVDYLQLLQQTGSGQYAENLDSHTFLGVEVWEVGWCHSVWTLSSVNATAI